jgi:GNAT superfamily N-acetyltransferase
LVTLRIALPEDLEVLREFEQGIVAAERPFDPTLADRDVHYYDIAAMLADEGVRFVVAEAQGEAVGCGFARIEAAKPYLKHRRQGYLGLMFVKPGHRGRGVNQLIIDALKAWCLANEVRELRLDVYAGNNGALRAYEKAGFQSHLMEMRLALGG